MPRRFFPPIVIAAILILAITTTAANAEADEVAKSSAAPTEQGAKTPEKTAAATSDKSGSKEVHIGFYPNDIFDLDLRRCCYVADCYIWLRWNGDLKPDEFEFMNGKMDVKEHPDSKEVNGVKYVSYHCRGSFHTCLDFHKYPLDSHTLEIDVEDALHDTKELQYVVDSSNMRHSHPIEITGWECSQPRFEVRNFTYETNYGDPTQSSPAAVYSRFYALFDITHADASNYFKTFLGLFISVGIAFLAFLIDPHHTEPRFGVGIAAVFGAVTSEMVIAGNLPDMPYFTLADYIHFISLFFIFLSLLQSCLFLRLGSRYKEGGWHRLDTSCVIIFPACYALTIGLVTWAVMAH
jgi:hypothetical protein